MTRETALYKLCEREDNPLNIINEVFNDFESRKCKNCKHSRDTAGYKGALDCIKGYATEVIDCGSDWHVDENFGCNEWERKEDV